MKTAEKENILGNKALGWACGLAFAGSVLLGGLCARGQSWAGSALVGWLCSVALGLLGWWTTRQGLGGDTNRFFKFVLGGMTLRFFLCGTLAGLFLATGWVQPAGFVWGLIVGVLLFLGLEIGAVYAAAQTEGETERG